MRHSSQIWSCGKVEARKELIKDGFKKLYEFWAIPDDLLSRALKELAGVTGEPLSSSYFWGQWVDGWGAWRLERSQSLLDRKGGGNDLGNQRLVKLFVNVPEMMGVSISFQASWNLLVYNEWCWEFFTSSSSPQFLGPTKPGELHLVAEWSHLGAALHDSDLCVSK